MLYKLSPNTPTVMWADLPARDLMKHAEENDLDLGPLDVWQLAEARVFSDDFLRLALRYGIACSGGIVVSGVDVANLGRSDELRLLNHHRTELHDDLRKQDTLMERLIPGWTAHGEQLDRQISESMDRTAAEADEDLAEDLDRPTKPGLEQHWLNLGGHLPDPA